MNPLWTVSIWRALQWSIASSHVLFSFTKIRLFAWHKVGCRDEQSTSTNMPESTAAHRLSPDLDCDVSVLVLPSTHFHSFVSSLSLRRPIQQRFTLQTSDTSSGPLLMMAKSLWKGLFRDLQNKRASSQVLPFSPLYRVIFLSSREASPWGSWLMESVRMKTRIR